MPQLPQAIPGTTSSSAGTTPFRTKNYHRQYRANYTKQYGLVPATIAGKATNCHYAAQGTSPCSTRNYPKQYEELPQVLARTTRNYPKQYQELPRQCQDCPVQCQKVPQSASRPKYCHEIPQVTLATTPRTSPGSTRNYTRQHQELHQAVSGNTKQCQE